jgi:hypothetical protein
LSSGLFASGTKTKLRVGGIGILQPGIIADWTDRHTSTPL